MLIHLTEVEDSEVSGRPADQQEPDVLPTWEVMDGAGFLALAARVAADRTAVAGVPQVFPAAAVAAAAIMAAAAVAADQPEPLVVLAMIKAAAAAEPAELLTLAE